MKAVAFNGSPRKGRNTEFMFKTVLGELDTEGIATEYIQSGGKMLPPKACTPQPAPI